RAPADFRDLGENEASQPLRNIRLADGSGTLPLSGSRQCTPKRNDISARGDDYWGPSAQRQMQSESMKRGLERRRIGRCGPCAPEPRLNLIYRQVVKAFGDRALFSGDSAD